MIRRLYLDNIRSFVNFEWEPGKLSLLLGRNGSGKTALFETIAALRTFLLGGDTASAFPSSSRTRWETRSKQSLELVVELGQSAFDYRVEVVHDVDSGSATIAGEILSCDGRVVVQFRPDGLHVVVGTEGTTVIPGANRARSGVGAVQGATGSDLERFQKWVRGLWVLRPDPRAMAADTDRRRVSNVPWLASNLSNFAAWYPPMLTTKPGTMFKAIQSLADSLPGFTELFQEDGLLCARFETGGTSATYSFDELSDGERMLIALACVTSALGGPDKTLLLDEPDNYLALREVQPWMADLVDATLRKGGPQVFLISHHPDTLNFLAIENGWRVFRDGAGPTRISRFEVKPEAGSPAEAMATGLDEPS